MVKLVKIDGEVLKKVPNILGFIEKYYGYDIPLIVYGVLIDEKFGFVVRNGNDCIYIVDNNLEMVSFEVDEDDTLLSVVKDGYKKYYHVNSESYCELNTGVESYLDFEKNESPDLEGYNGLVVYTQYDPSRDLRCEIQYPHMYREMNDGGNPPIYEFHTNSFRSVYIDKKFLEKGLREKGILGNRHLYYNKMTVYEGDIDYDISAINDFGLVKFLENGSYKLYGTDKIYKFCKAKFITASGYFVTLFPFCATYTEDSIKEYIEDLGFSSKIPEFIFNSYNGKDEMFNVVEEIVRQMQEIDKNKNDDMRMILKLQQD